jgi:hypothetical protein
MRHGRPLRQGLREGRLRARRDRARRAGPLGSDVRERELVRAGTRDDHEINPFGDETRHRPETFTAEPLDAVSLDRVADFARDDDSEARRAGAVAARGHEQHEVIARDARAFALHAQKIGALAEAPIFSEVGERRPLYFLYIATVRR